VSARLPPSATAPPLVLIIGGTSDVGKALAHHYAATGAGLVVTVRDAGRFEADAVDLRIRHGGEVQVIALDVRDIAAHTRFLDALPRLPDIAICVVGALGDHAVSARDAEAARLVMETNYVAPALLLGAIANRFEARGSGTLVGISSVAGERGRASNYVYGSAKAGLTAYLSGLRARLSRTPVRVVTVKPGFIATRMTAGMALPPLLTAQPAEVAAAVARAVAGRRDVVYTRRVWSPIMAIIRMLPERVFKKTKF
jgi:short-subunit dehydrogenase